MQHLVTLRKPSGLPLFLGSEIIFSRENPETYPVIVNGFLIASETAP